MAKDFWFPFEPAKWLTDPELRACSKRARATWMDILCVMHSCEVKGVLRTGSRAWTLEEIAAAVPGDTSENLADITELLSKGVASREEGTGAVLCRMMFRRFQISQKRRESGKKGGNPVLLNQKSNQTSSKGITKPPTKPVVLNIGMSLEEKGVQGEEKPLPEHSGLPPPPADPFSLVPADLEPLLKEFTRGFVGGLAYEMAAVRIRDHGLDAFRYALQQAVSRGCHTKWHYVDGILRNGVGLKPRPPKDRPSAKEMHERLMRRRT
mgnify:CR=1 FL=1